jgi:hypothetical protein
MKRDIRNDELIGTDEYAAAHFDAHVRPLDAHVRPPVSPSSVWST